MTVCALTFANSPTSVAAQANASVSAHRCTYDWTFGNADTASPSPSESTIVLAVTPTTTSAREGVAWYREQRIKLG